MIWRPTTQGILLAVVLIVLGCSVSPTSTTTQREPTAIPTQISTGTFTHPPTWGTTPEATPAIAPAFTAIMPSVSPLAVPTFPTQKATQPQSTTTVIPAPIGTPDQSLMCAQTQGTSVEISGEDVPLHEALCVMGLDDGIVRVQVADGLVLGGHTAEEWAVGGRSLALGGIPSLGTL